MIAQHSSATNEHYTPAIVVEPARALLGGFDLDPASCVEANERVKATRILTIADDGLSVPWSGRVFLNPPGGKLKRVGDRWIPVKAGPGKSSMQIWWDKLAQEWILGNVTEAFFVAFTLEILRTSQACSLPVQAFPRCYPSERLAFRGDDPTHANVLVYLPPRDLAGSAFVVEKLRKHFGHVGLCEGSTIGTSTVRAELLCTQPGYNAVIDLGGKPPAGNGTTLPAPDVLPGQLPLIVA